MARRSEYHVAFWEKVVLMALSVGVILSFLFIIIRNQKFADPNIVVIARITLSLSVAAIGALIPGFLRIGWSGGGLTVRAGGALGLFALTYFYTPQVLNGVKQGGDAYPFMDVSVPRSAKVSDSDPPGAIEVENTELFDFLLARAEDKQIFALSVEIPRNLRFKADKSDPVSLEGEHNFEKNIALIVQKIEWITNSPGEVMKYASPSEVASFSLGSKTQFDTGFSRLKYNRFKDSDIYRGFFQVFMDAAFAGYRMYTLQTVAPDSQRAVETIRLLERTE